MVEFVGTLSASKSLMNRALIAKSFKPSLNIQGESTSHDVQLMRSALVHLAEGKRGADGGKRIYECGDAGAVLRFLALRVSRVEGEHLLKGSERLFSRPQRDLEKVLRQLGCEIELGKTTLRIRSYGWRLQGDGLFISGAKSSQFASGVILSAWDLPFALPITFNGKKVSEGYWRMTLSLCRKLGMLFDMSGSEIIIHPWQTISAHSYEVEIDVSSAFAVTALAVMNGSARILNFPPMSVQPDAVFVSLLQKMQLPIEVKNDQLHARRADSWQGLNADLNTCPDLLPVLAVLCAFAKTPSTLSGLDHLRFKESDRLAKTQELLTRIGARAEVFENGTTTLKITPVEEGKPMNDFRYDPDLDHRMAMAAAVARERGIGVEILSPEVVAKSFPDFWRIAGIP